MLLPRGKPVYSNLKTKIVKFDSLLDELKEETFTGYVQVELSNATGVVFMERGIIVGAFVDKKDVENPLSYILAESLRDPSGLISVFALDPELISVLSSVYGKKPAIKGFPFEVVDVEKLLDRLSREEFTGALTIEDPAKEAVFLMFFFQGEPFEYTYEDLEISLSGEAAVEKLYELNQSDTAKLDLIPSELEATISDQEEGEVITGDLRAEVQKFFDGVLPELLEELSIVDLKKAAVDLAEEYPFLDPFAPSVYVEDGRLVIEEDVPPEALLDGLSQWLKRLASMLDEKKRKTMYAFALDRVKNKKLLEPLLRALQ